MIPRMALQGSNPNRKLSGFAFVAFSCLHRSNLTCAAFHPSSPVASQKQTSSLFNLQDSFQSGSSKLFSKSRFSITSRAMSSTDTSCPASFTVAQFLCLSDNYGYLIHDDATGHTAAVDTPDAYAYKKELDKRGWKLTHIFNTHHHSDHVGGNLELKTDGVQIYGPAKEQNRIPGIDVAVNEGDTFEFGGTKGTIMDVGGHTLGHIAFHFPDDSAVFVGDALFSLGCGRMFEGTPPQFWNSLKKMRTLPDETTIYCAHEYTESNAKFAASVEPGNAQLMARVAEIKDKRSRGEPTVPSKMGEEKATNPFLRIDISNELRKNVGVVENDSEADAFAKVRRAKDTF
mmetsp:Transcript_10960/g.16936  ORF Transcript_10960/g.16936 Transcript_10960/m.16936 type:complete len:344 (-) Transcript_10960:73-1104(-)